ncbi:MAG TPA: bifunctional riboflavin kinase/FAD synthetase [Verrucomicrobiota bacterium]|nr:bifunctional riboflavin kinase/FAD synthetase [Verrucomicrobiota bacterium]
MKLIHQSGDLSNDDRRVSLAIGMFDGVHIGHQQVLRQAIEDSNRNKGRSVAVTFDRHPTIITAPDRAPALLQTLSQRLRAIESLGVDATLLIEFDEEFSRKPGAEFVHELTDCFGTTQSICVGTNFTFGHQRDSSIELLDTLGRALGFQVQGLQAVSLGSQPVSSTRIRAAVREGHLDEARQMLGRSFAIEGIVIKGEGRGHELGFPTANLDGTGLALPPNGVYTAQARLTQSTHRAVLNIGLCPTLANPASALQVEVHLLDFNADLYGQTIEIEPIERLRDEQRFASIDELAAQISSDIAHARTLF